MIHTRRTAGVQGLLDEPPPPFRVAYLQPYHNGSYFNIPLGVDAVEMDALLPFQLTSGGKVSVDPLFWGGDTTQPVRVVENGNLKDHDPQPDQPPNATFGYPSMIGNTFCHASNSMTHNSGWNGICGVLNSANPRQAWTGQPLNRPTGTESVKMYGAESNMPTGIRGLDDLYGDGRRGAHGGGECGGIGGAIRQHEYDAAIAGNQQAIYHKIGINLDGYTMLSACTPTVTHSAPRGPGWRWPAYKADTNFNQGAPQSCSTRWQEPRANNTYGRATPTGVVMGTTLALPLSYNISGISDPLLSALAWTMQHFGMVVVDVVGWTPRYAINLEKTRDAAWTARSNTTFHTPLVNLFTDCVFIHDISPTTPGGAGTPRCPPPPELEP